MNCVDAGRAWANTSVSRSRQKRLTAARDNRFGGVILAAPPPRTRSEPRDLTPAEPPCSKGEQGVSKARCDNGDAASSHRTPAPCGVQYSDAAPQPNLYDAAILTRADRAMKPEAKFSRRRPCLLPLVGGHPAHDFGSGDDRARRTFDPVDFRAPVAIEVSRPHERVFLARSARSDPVVIEAVSVKHFPVGHLRIPPGAAVFGLRRRAAGSRSSTPPAPPGLREARYASFPPSGRAAENYARRRTRKFDQVNSRPGPPGRLDALSAGSSGSRESRTFALPWPLPRREDRGRVRDVRPRAPPSGFRRIFLSEARFRSSLARCALRHGLSLRDGKEFERSGFQLTNRLNRSRCAGPHQRTMTRTSRRC